MTSRLVAVIGCVLLAACSSRTAPGEPRDLDPTDGSATLDPSGGSVSLPDGPRLALPPGALPATTAITIRTSTEAAPSWALSSIYEFGPDETEFLTTVTVSFAVSPETDAATVYWTRPGSATEYDAFPATVVGTTASAGVTHLGSGFVGPATDDPCDAHGAWTVRCTPAGDPCAATIVTLAVPAGSTQSGGSMIATILGSELQGTFAPLACAAGKSFADSCDADALAAFAFHAGEVAGTVTMSCPGQCGGPPVEWQCSGQRTAWYDVYGDSCGDAASAGCNFYADGSQIIDIEDPYFQSDYYLEYAYWEYVDPFGYTQYYLGWGWLSPNGILYDEYGRALN